MVVVKCIPCLPYSITFENEVVSHNKSVYSGVYSVSKISNQLYDWLYTSWNYNAKQCFLAEAATTVISGAHSIHLRTFCLYTGCTGTSTVVAACVVRFEESSSWRNVKKVDTLLSRVTLSLTNTVEDNWNEFEHSLYEGLIKKTVVVSTIRLCYNNWQCYWFHYNYCQWWCCFDCCWSRWHDLGFHHFPERL